MWCHSIVVRLMSQTLAPSVACVNSSGLLGCRIVALWVTISSNQYRSDDEARGEDCKNMETTTGRGKSVGQPGRLSDRAYERIKRDIIVCALEPGQNFTEEQLAEEYDVGRAAVRSAVKRLYQEQLIQVGPAKRYAIAPITLKHAQDVYQMRLLLEPAAARMAAGTLNPEQVADLERLGTAQYEPGDRQSAEDFLRSNSAFHVQVARASGNEIMAEMVASLLDRAERLNHLSHMLGDRNEEAVHEHHELLDALIRGDCDRAEAVMREQIESAKRFVMGALTSSPVIQSMNVLGPTK
jgi:DNA-binding GntR family transcriptional regulator